MVGLLILLEARADYRATEVLREHGVTTTAVIVVGPQDTALDKYSITIAFRTLDGHSVQVDDPAGYDGPKNAGTRLIVVYDPNRPSSLATPKEVASGADAFGYLLLAAPCIVFGLWQAIRALHRLRRVPDADAACAPATTTSHQAL